MKKSASVMMITMCVSVTLADGYAVATDFPPRDSVFHNIAARLDAMRHDASPLARAEARQLRILIATLPPYADATGENPYSAMEVEVLGELRDFFREHGFSVNDIQKVLDLYGYDIARKKRVY
jgi:hypothetical protein